METKPGNKNKEMQEKIKVLLLAPLGGVTGGISRWTGHLMKYYDQNGKQDCNIDLVSTGRRYFVNANSTPAYRLITGIKDYHSIFKNFRRKINKSSYDVMHLTSSGSWSLLKDLYFLKNAQKKGIKTIIHFRFGRIPELFHNKNWEYKLLIKVLNVSDKVLVLDQMTYDTLRNHGYNNIEILPNPVAPEVENFVKDNSSNISRDNNTILFIGHVVPTKGVFELVEACKGIKDIKVKMIGTVLPDVKSQLMESAKVDDNNSWLEICGERPYSEVLTEMMKCSVFVLPTYTEGFPNVILESMACGCAIIASGVGAIPEMLDQNGDEQSGIVVSIKNVEELKTAINMLLCQPEQRKLLGHKAQNRVYRMFNMRSVWQELIRIWNTK